MSGVERGVDRGCCKDSLQSFMDWKEVIRIRCDDKGWC